MRIIKEEQRERRKQKKGSKKENGPEEKSLFLVPGGFVAWRAGETLATAVCKSAPLRATAGPANKQTSESLCTLTFAAIPLSLYPSGSFYLFLHTRVPINLFCPDSCYYSPAHAQLHPKMSLSYSQIHKKAQEAQAKQQQLQDAKIPGFFIPETAKEWRELSRRATCNNIFRLNEGAIQSGSKATDTQFVCYRALCERLKSRKAFVGQRARFGITNDIWEAAGKFLAECDELQLFLDLIEKQIPVQSLTHKDDEWPRSWVLPKLSTEHITSTVNRSTRQENDEALQQERQQMAESIRTQFRNLFSEEGTTSSSTMEVRSSSAGGRRVRSTPGTAFQVHTETTTPATSKAEFPDAFDETVVNTYIVQLLELLSLILNH